MGAFILIGLNALLMAAAIVAMLKEDKLIAFEDEIVKKWRETK